VKPLISILLTLAGAGLILVAIVTALEPLLGLYQGALADPLGQPEGSERQAADRMLGAALWGLPGVVLFLVGVIWLKVLAARRIARAARRR